MCLLVISGIQNKNPREIALIGLKHINLKEASDAIRQQFGKNKRLRFLKQSFQKIKVLVDTDFVHLHNHTSVLQSTISIPQLVKAASKEKCLQLP
jgi:DNA polymerase-3 subunit alpha